MTPSSSFRWLALVAALLVATLPLHAQDLDAVKARMEQRVAAVDALKDRGVAGENNRGFLEARGAGADQALIAAENADRRAVYAAIAAQTRQDADSVGRTRAQRIAQQSRPGVWLQGADGAWYQRK